MSSSSSSSSHTAVSNGVKRGLTEAKGPEFVAFVFRAIGPIDDSDTSQELFAEEYSISGAARTISFMKSIAQAAYDKSQLKYLNGFDVYRVVSGRSVATGDLILTKKDFYGMKVTKDCSDEDKDSEDEVSVTLNPDFAWPTAEDLMELDPYADLTMVLGSGNPNLRTRRLTLEDNPKEPEKERRRKRRRHQRQ